MRDISHGLGNSSTPGGDRIFNACQVLVYRYRKTPRFLPCHKDDKYMEIAIITLNRAVSHTGLFQNIISDREPNSTSSLWTNLHNLFGTKFSFSSSYYSETDEMEARMIQALKEIVRRFCAYGIEFKDSDGFIHD
ncbi:hypothetical protein O181_000319 [Austropuccinia psidii MF-1]|uniref:Integrase catalytic domain-containing protein n=1 Tax=Austropuccinia psidii MF-1 TaxID=1389203 RepID=A0A9Q3B8E8_9BASI|nr:hypothetical protein [Austropuccinia psidii MF-1]